MAPVDIIGSVAPDLEVEVVSPDGSTSTTSLASLRPAGQMMVVDFFAPWCKTCPAKATELEALAQGEYGERCTFVLVCVDAGAADKPQETQNAICSNTMATINFRYCITICYWALCLGVFQMLFCCLTAHQR